MKPWALPIRTATSVRTLILGRGEREGKEEWALRHPLSGSQNPL